jgi:SH3-like domain-containing protein
MRATKFMQAVIVCAILAAAGAAYAERLAVSAGVANVRSGPGTQYDVLWQAEQYTPIEVINRDQTGSWLYFKDFEGTKAWVSKNLVEKIDSVIVKQDRVNIRSGPSTNEHIVFRAEKGVPFRVLQRKGEWLQIQHADGETGWMHQMLVW